MKSLDQAYFKGSDTYPLYTLCMANYVQTIPDYRRVEIPVVVCQYDEKTVVPYVYDNIEDARTAFDLFVDR